MQLIVTEYIVLKCKIYRLDIMVLPLLELYIAIQILLMGQCLTMLSVKKRIQNYMYI